MRGFAERADVEDVDLLLRRHVCALGVESVPLAECVGRVLAQDAIARVDVPSFARSAMDGYAVRGQDSFGASEYGPLDFEVIGETYPGRAFEGRVGADQAVRIMTGAPLPEGADAVVRAEVCSESEGRVAVSEPVAPRKNVGAVGEDIRAGELLLRTGRRLRAQDAGVLASIGVAEVRCVRRPSVQLLITGDELLSPGSMPEGCRIVDSNSVVLQALVRRDGGTLLPFEIQPDRAEVIRARLADSSADVILVSGGNSVGQEDHAPRLLAELGKLDFHGVSMRPSSPAGGGRIGERHVFLLPGNPVSCLCAYEFFAGPSIRALGGRSRAWPHRRLHAPLARKISSEVGRTDYVRVALDNDQVVPLATSGASMLSSTVRADGVVIVPRALEGMPEGARVQVLLYDEDAPEPEEAE